MTTATKTGKCPSCLQSGDINEGCPACPGFVYTHQWADLNDVFADGSLEVWYLKRECFRSHGTVGDQKPDPKNLEATHILVGKIAPSPNGYYLPADLDNAWVKLQGEFWSPNGEANEFVRGLGVHTSMSVGDCFRFTCGCPVPRHKGEVWRVEVVGLTKLGEKTFDSRTFKKVK